MATAFLRLTIGTIINREVRQNSIGFYFRIIPVIYGYIAQSSLTDFAESGAQAKFTLISRRSVRRAGVRYLRRGIDPTGDVANFVETESIISASGHCLSFVQVIIADTFPFSYYC